MATTASTTIAGVSVLTGDERSSQLFDLALSADGIEIRRADQPPRRMSWTRVSAWDVEQRRDDVVLTLRGDGATTPLRITGWSAEELEALLRSLTSRTTAAPEAVAAPGRDDDPVAESAAPAASRQERRRRVRRRRVGGKAVLTVVLLLVLATAVTLVLLQSAGVIDWGFLGRTA